MNEDEIVIRQTYRHPVAKVFGAFADARAIEQWLSPAPEISIDVKEFDFRQGGNYRYDYQLPDGTRATLNGQFVRLIRDRLISFSWTWAEPDPHAGIVSHVVVAFRADPAGTELTITHTKLQAAAMPDRHAQGWRGSLHRLEHYLTTETKSI